MRSKSLQSEGAVQRWLSPPQIAAELGVDPAKIVSWIRTGELVAINIVAKTGGRPRYRVSPPDLADFLRRRRVGPPSAPARRKCSTFTRKYYA